MDKSAGYNKHKDMGSNPQNNFKFGQVVYMLVMLVFPWGDGRSRNKYHLRFVGQLAWHMEQKIIIKNSISNKVKGED